MVGRPRHIAFHRDADHAHVAEHGHVTSLLRHKATCNVRHICLGAMFILVGSVLLCGFGFTIVMPHQVTQHWPDVECTVTNWTVNRRFCSCDRHRRANQDWGEEGGGGEGEDEMEESVEYLPSISSNDVRNPMCSDNQPCLQVFVSYTPVEHNTLSIDQGVESSTRYESDNTEENTQSELQQTAAAATLSSLPKANSSVDLVRRFIPVTNSSQHSNNTSTKVATDIPKQPQQQIGILYRSWSDAFYETCSLHECSDERWNLKEANTFRAKWGQIGKRFPCHYDPANPRTVLIERTPVSTLVHVILWPVLALLAGTIMWVGLCMGCWQVEISRDSRPPSRFIYTML